MSGMFIVLLGDTTRALKARVPSGSVAAADCWNDRRRVRAQTKAAPAFHARYRSTPQQRPRLTWTAALVDDFRDLELLADFGGGGRGSVPQVQMHV